MEGTRFANERNFLAIANQLAKETYWVFVNSGFIDAAGEINLHVFVNFSLLRSGRAHCSLSGLNSSSQLVGGQEAVI